MTDMQKVLMRLLDEVDSLCSENGLHYFLGYEAALSAYRTHKFETSMSSVTLFMPYNDIIKLREAINRKNNPQRCFDSIIDNPHYPNLTFRYSDESTLYYNLKDNYGNAYKSHGIFIKICPLRKIRGGRLAPLTNDMEFAWYCRRPDYRAKNVDTQRLREKYGKYIKRNNSLYRKVLLKLFARSQRDAVCSDALVFMGMDGRITEFPKGIFSKIQKVELEGREYPIPYDEQKFFIAQYSYNWKNHKFAKVNIGESFIVDTTLPYGEYFDYIKKQGIDCDFSRYSDRQKAAKLEMMRNNVPIDNAWVYVQRSAARYKMREKYLPLKDEIMRLHQQDNLSALEEMLEEYDDVCRKFIAKGMTVYFDREIFDIYKQLLVRKGCGDMADALEKNIPSVHLCNDNSVINLNEEA